MKVDIYNKDGTEYIGYYVGKLKHIDGKLIIS